MVNNFNYQTNVSFILLEDKKPKNKELFAICEVKDIANYGNSFNYAPVFWFPNCKITEKEAKILRLEKYVNESRKHPDGYIISGSKSTRQSFARAVVFAIRWFEKIHREKKPVIASQPKQNQRFPGPASQAFVSGKAQFSRKRTSSSKKK